MSELKTFKELLELHGPHLYDQTIKEAIKWFKHLEKTKKNNVFDFLETFFDIPKEKLEDNPNEPQTGRSFQ